MLLAKLLRDDQRGRHRPSIVVPKNQPFDKVLCHQCCASFTFCQNICRHSSVDLPGGGSRPSSCRQAAAIFTSVERSKRAPFFFFASAKGKPPLGGLGVLSSLFFSGDAFETPSLTPSALRKRFTLAFVSARFLALFPL